MASIAGFFLIALLCTVHCSPIGESLLPTVGTSVCETTPNVLANLGHGFGPLSMNLPTPLAWQLLSQSMVPSLGQTTVCDSKTVPVLSPYGLPTGALPTQTQTVCESASNVLPTNLPVPYGLGLPTLLKGLTLPGLVSNYPGSTTVCESASSPVSPWLGLNSQMLGGLPLGGMNLPYNGLGLSLNGLGLPMNGLGLSINGLGLPVNGLAGLVNSLGLPVL